MLKTIKKYIESFLEWFFDFGYKHLYGDGISEQLEADFMETTYHLNHDCPCCRNYEKR